MINITTLKRLVCLSVIAAGYVLASGSLAEVNAQRDPFAKPSFMKVRKPSTGTSASGKPGTPAVPVNYGPPTIESRIEYFKRLRETAAANGDALPKVTSVLTLNEMAVTGIFKTPRGYAAMVEATPIKLSYTIYPGEKFFDGQLVAVEENRLVFRKVSKVGDGKFVASVENKSLRQYSTRAQIEGTAPAQSSDKPVQTASTTPAAAPAAAGKAPSNPFLSPLDEMDTQTDKPATEKAKTSVKKTVKVARTTK